MKIDLPTFLVTGGAGFIGSNFVLLARRNAWARIINLDRLTYAGNLDNLQGLRADPQHIFVRGDIGDRPLVDHLLQTYQPDALIHCAAESHVDRSIRAPEIFIQTNVLGTYQLLEASLHYWQNLGASKRDKFRFLHISTDEVYGSLTAHAAPFTEHHPYQPSSPYAASKAAADHLVRAYHNTYGLPILSTNCSNNYGARQFPEKLIPLMILNALAGEPLPIYGDGQNVRDWLYVDDHCEALYRVLTLGTAGETYNIGGNNEVSNLEVVRMLCRILEDIVPRQGDAYEQLITFVPDRLGHDRRYGVDCSKLMATLGWRSQVDFANGMKKTVRWYVDNMEWVDRIRSGAYQQSS